MTKPEVWRDADPEIQAMFDKIEAWLPTVKGKYNTEFYNSLCYQWLEYGALSPFQKQRLKEIIERCIPK